MVSRGIRICLLVSTLFMIIITAIIVPLSLTTFKLKDPNINVYPVGLEHFQIPSTLDLNSNFTLGMLISIENPNFGSFEYKNSTGYVNFYDYVVAEVPIESKFVPPHHNINVSTNASLMVGKLIQHPKFWSDVMPVGTLNLTSTAKLPGHARIFNIIKLKAATYSSCDISFNIFSRQVNSKCVSKIKL